MLCVEMLCLLLLRLMIERCIPLIPCKNVNSPLPLIYEDTILAACVAGVECECSGLGVAEFGDICIAQI